MKDALDFYAIVCKFFKIQLNPFQLF